jgi:hypothetical protein
VIPRWAVVAVVVAVLLGAAGVVWRFLPPRAVTQAPTFIADDARLLSPDGQARLAGILAAVLRDTDIEVVVFSLPSPDQASLARAAEELFESRAVGARSRGNRGVLLLIAPAARRVRLAVGYGAEEIFPDAFVGYVEHAQMAPYFASGRTAEGVEATVELLARQAYEKVLGRAYDPRERVATGDGFRGGGAGAETALATVSAKRPGATDDAALHERFGPQPSPDQAWARFLEIQRRRIKAPDLGLYDDAAQALLRQRPNTDAGQDHIARLYDGKPHVVRRRGDRVAVVFLDDPQRLLAPWFFRRSARGWQLDGATPPGLIRYNHLNQWRFARRDHPYAFAFEDFAFDANGFATHRPVR